MKNRVRCEWGAAKQSQTHLFYCFSDYSGAAGRPAVPPAAFRIHSEKE